MSNGKNTKHKRGNNGEITIAKVSEYVSDRGKSIENE